MEEMKKCTDCGKDLPLSEFNTHHSGGLMKVCKECESKRRSLGQRKRYLKANRASQNGGG